MNAEEFRLVRDAVYGVSGILIQEELKFLLERRLASRLEVLGLPDFTTYYRHLCSGSVGREELDTAVELLATHETYFFREPVQLEAFRRELLPRLHARKLSTRRLQLWSAGCSTGEEPYTLAMLILDSGLFAGWDIQIFATDLSRRVLATARRGEYGPASLRSTPESAIDRHFERIGDRVQVNPEVRDLVTFGNVNLLDPNARTLVPASDVVFCRNVMIYFDTAARTRLIQGIYERLVPGGYLLLGHSENLLHWSTDFELVHLKGDLVYRRPERDA